MTKCFICREDLRQDEVRICDESTGELIEAHEVCTKRMMALLSKTSNSQIIFEKDYLTTIIQKNHDEYMLIKRDIPYTMAILAYVDRVGQATDVKEIYGWLKKNELRMANPSDAIGKMTKSGFLAVINSGTIRLVTITDKGRTELKKCVNIPSQQ
jgi:hypothetical protein